jgi:hypothetical protein
MKTVIELQAISFSLLFFLSSISKINSISEFIYSINDFEIIPEKYSPYISIVIILTELCLATSFALFHFLYLTYICSLFLIGTFTGLFFYIQFKKKIIRCHCFGQSQKATKIKDAIIRNFIILSLSIFGLFTSTVPSKLENNQILIVFLLIGVALLFELIKLIASSSQLIGE